MNNLEIGQTVQVWAGERRVATGKVVKIFKNAVDVDRIESEGSIGPFGVKRFFYAQHTIR